MKHASTALASTAAIGVVVTALVSAATPGPLVDTAPGRRSLRPAGALVALGNLPLAAAGVNGGKFVWTLSGGPGPNDIRVVDTRQKRVSQTIELPGVGEGIAVDEQRRLVYVSGLPGRATEPGGDDQSSSGDVIDSFSFDRTGVATRLGAISLVRHGEKPGKLWPSGIALAEGGTTLVVALNLANKAALVDLSKGTLSYVTVGDHPAGVGIVGSKAFVANEGDGTVSVIDLRSRRRVRTIVVGTPLSHPRAVLTDARSHVLYVSLTQADAIGVINTVTMKEARVFKLRGNGLSGASPTAMTLLRGGRYLAVAESGCDDVAIIRRSTRSKHQREAASRLSLVGHIPTGAYPISVVEGSIGEVIWVAARGLLPGPNPSHEYLPTHIRGELGVVSLVRRNELKDLSSTNAIVARQVLTTPPVGTPLKPPNLGGRFRHVFFIVRENRTYDQVLGDDSRGNGDPQLTLFGKNITPNYHSLVRRFPLLDNVLSNSTVSADGHLWSSAGVFSDYISRNAPATYSERGRPWDYGIGSISWPKALYLFDRMRAHHIEARNYGEAYAGVIPTAGGPTTSGERKLVAERVTRADLGPPSGCYPSDFYVYGHDEKTGHEIFDGPVPQLAPADSESRFACFSRTFGAELRVNRVPTFNYLVLPNNHTSGTFPGRRTPQALIADNDYALGKVVERITHSRVWKTSLILVVEDDSQDGADHVDAHRIPALIISPYARRGVVVSEPYDTLSFVRTAEIAVGLGSDSFFEAVARPLYAALATSPRNSDPYEAVLPDVDLLERNRGNAPMAKVSSRLDFQRPDAVPQGLLDEILWRSVHGEKSAPPPAGPHADKNE